MKVLVNTTVLVYFSQVRPEFPSRLGVATIGAVASELEHVIGGAEAKEILEGTDVLQARRSRALRVEGNWLSDADVALLSTAKETGRLLVTDDKKLLAAARKNNCDALDTPHFIESLSQKIDKQEALEILERLRRFYLRRKVIDAVVEKIERW